MSEVPTVAAQLSAFDAAAQTPDRLRFTRRAVVKRLREAIAGGLVTFDPTTDRVTLTARGRTSIKGLRVVPPPGAAT